MDPFRRLLLDTVNVVLHKEASKESLHELLRIATPNLDEDEINDPTKREKLFKLLKVRIHPDKHLGDERATELYQDVQIFYNDCVSSLDTQKKNRSRHSSPTPTRYSKKKQQCSSPTSTRYPFDFDVRNIWPFLSFDQPAFPITGCTSEGLASLTAYQCINSRGAIAHGNKTELSYSRNEPVGVLNKIGGNGVYNKKSSPYGIILKIFSSFGGGVRTLRDTESIKDELMKRGPVVSTSFCLMDAKHAEVFLSHQVGKPHAVLIVGWKLTESGEMWLVKPLKRSNSAEEHNVIVPVPFGHFGIDDVCIAPESRLEDKSWQNGPYFDHDMSTTSQEWRKSWPSMNLRIVSSQLEKLGQCIEGGFCSVGKRRSTFVLRDIKKPAHSRRCCVREVEWDDAHERWKVVFDFVPLS